MAGVSWRLTGFRVCFRAYGGCRLGGEIFRGPGSAGNELDHLLMVGPVRLERGRRAAMGKTTMRSLTSKTCSTLWLIRITETSAARRFRTSCNTWRELFHAQRRCRFIHDDQLRSPAGCAADRHGLPLAAREIAHLFAQRRQPNAQVRQMPLGVPDHATVIERQTAKARHFPTQIEILNRVEGVDQREILIDGFDAERFQGPRVLETHLRALYADRAAAGTTTPEITLISVDFPALVAHKSNHLRIADIEIDAVESDHRAERLAYAP